MTAPIPFSDLKTLGPPSISVVIVGRNVESFVGDALNSLVQQIDSPDEVIYYDDASTDESLRQAEQFVAKLPMLKIMKGRERLGISKARNLANKFVESDYIAVLDADDLYLPDTVLKYRETIRNRPDLDLLYADTLVFKDGKKLRWRMRYPCFMERSRPNWYLMIRPVLPFKHSSVVYRKAMIDEVGGYCEELPLKVDFELLLRLLDCNATIGKLDSATSQHRSHGGQVSKKRIDGIPLYWKVIDWHEPNRKAAAAIKACRAMGEVFKFCLGR